MQVYVKTWQYLILKWVIIIYYTPLLTSSFAFSFSSKSSAYMSNSASCFEGWACLSACSTWKTNFSIKSTYYLSRVHVFITFFFICSYVSWYMSILPVRVNNSFATSVSFIILTAFGSSSVYVLDSFFFFHLSAVVNFFFSLPGYCYNSHLLFVVTHIPNILVIIYTKSAQRFRDSFTRFKIF